MMFADIPDAVGGSENSPTRTEVRECAESVVVGVTAGVAASLPDVWATIEGAVDLAVGRTVVLDLTGFKVFDDDLMCMTNRVARDAIRQHVDICVAVSPGSALMRYVNSCGVDKELPIYASVSAATGATRHP